MSKSGEHLGVRESPSSWRWGFQPWGCGNGCQGEERRVRDVHIGKPF